MKKISLLFLVFAMGKAQAQTPWYIGGNAVSSNSVFGTTTPYDIKFIRFNQPYGFFGAGNLALGGEALNSVTTGASNYAYGRWALRANTSGTLNSAFGETSLLSNTTGHSNNAFGAYTLQANTTGYANCAFGENSLFHSSTGVYNIGYGTNTMYVVTTGSYNTAIGGATMDQATTGNYNVGMGWAAGGTLSTGSSNIFIGANTNVNISPAANNQLNIGNWIYGYNGNIGIGALNPGNKLEITGGGSGLRFTNLPNTAAALTNTTNKVLSVNSTGDVILVNDQMGIPSVSAAQGLTFNGTSVVLGDNCGAGGGGFTNSREVNMLGKNLYFNSSDAGKLYMGREVCKELATRLEISSKGLSTVNGYDVAPSPSGLRFSNLTAQDPTVENLSHGVLSLDRDGDVIWVKDQGGSDENLNHWNLNGNIITDANYLGTNNDVDLIFKRNLQFSGIISNTNTSFGLSGLTANSGANNSAFGANSLRYNTSGNDNSAVGSSALLLNTTGQANTATGALALLNNTTGNVNTADGHYALSNNTSGIANTSQGNASLYSNTKGSNNTANGASALYANSNGDYNTGMGLNALFTNVSGSWNTVIGANSSTGITTGSGNTIVGANVNFLPSGLTNTIILADGNGANRLYIDGNGDAGFGTTSPTAALHVNCAAVPLAGASNVRFENLQQGAGNILVVDANGYVMQASATAFKGSQADVDGIKKELSETKELLSETRRALEELRAQVNALSGKQAVLAEEKITGDVSLTIVPTPFSNNARAVYSIGKMKGQASLKVFDSKGALISTFPISRPEGEIQLGNLPASTGPIFFKLVAGENVLISKTSIKL